MKGNIYIIINTINGKMYVGKTYLTIEDRFKEHLYNRKKYLYSNKNIPLYRAFNKYGINNFFLGYLGTFDSNTLEKKEIYYINLFNTYKDGYNATLGGDGKLKYNFTKKEVCESINNSNSIKEVCFKLNNMSYYTFKKITKRYGLNYKKLLYNNKGMSNNITNNKLTEKEVFRIKYGNESSIFLQKEFKIHKRTVDRIRNNETWKYI